jgi:hypothetical protein
VRHVLLALVVLAVYCFPMLLRSLRRERARALRPSPEEPVEEHLSASGQLKVVVFAYDDRVMRLETFRLVPDGEPLAGVWRRVSAPSFVDNGALAGAVRDALRAGGGGDRRLE